MAAKYKQKVTHKKKSSSRPQIDVIEDQAFVSLTSLTSLDLSHNGIVAISGQSLSHLNRYNFHFCIQFEFLCSKMRPFWVRIRKLSHRKWNNYFSTSSGL